MNLCKKLQIYDEVRIFGLITLKSENSPLIQRRVEIDELYMNSWEKIQ